MLAVWFSMADQEYSKRCIWYSQNIISVQDIAIERRECTHETLYSMRVDIIHVYTENNHDATYLVYTSLSCDISQ